MTRIDTDNTDAHLTDRPKQPSVSEKTRLRWAVLHLPLI